MESSHVIVPTHQRYKLPLQHKLKLRAIFFFLCKKLKRGHEKLCKRNGRKENTKEGT
jgi:hypothetical protein